MKALRRLALCAAATGLVLTAGCAGAGSLGSSGNEVTIAMVSNSQMTDARELSAEFEAENPGTKLKFITLSENQARAKITMSTAMGGSEFDVVMISNFETPQWARDGWLLNLSDYAKNTPGYDEDDFIASLRESLSYEGNMYSVPFYGESSFLMYRKDLFEQAGIKVDQNPNYQPTWQEVAEWANKLKTDDRAGICLRGKPGWGEVLAPLDTVINTFGGRWFDENWNAQLNSPEVSKAVNFYVDLINNAGELGASSAGFQECANLFGQGQTAMWYDATSAVSVLEDPEGKPGPGRQDRVPARTDSREAELGLALHLVAGHPEGREEPRRRMEVHLVDDQQGLHEAGGREARLGPCPTGQPDVDLHGICRSTRRSPSPTVR